MCDHRLNPLRVLVPRNEPGAEEDAYRVHQGDRFHQGRRRGVESGGGDQRRERQSEYHRDHQPRQRRKPTLFESEAQYQTGTQDHHGGDENPNGLGDKPRKQTRGTVHRLDP